LKKHKVSRIGILTGGGDCPGLNAVLRSVTKTAIHDYGFEVFGIEDGYQGLIEKRGRFITSDDVSGILTHGGTILGTSNKSDPFRVPVSRGKNVTFEDHSADSIRHFKEWELDVLIVVGGDGTLKIGNMLFNKGVPVIGIPKTIDNDLSETDFTFGFDTAVEIATEALDRLHTTAASHHRVMILEVMGRNAGWIALYSGVAGGADVILLPEIAFDMKRVNQEVMERSKKGKRFSLVAVAEGAHPVGGKQIIQRKDLKNPYPEKLGGIGNWLAEKIQEQTGIETRHAVLGHIQRGGSPTPFDRNLGTLFGHHAVELIHQNKWGEMVCLKGQSIQSVPIKKAVQVLKTVPLDFPLIKAARAVGTSFGK
jgi:ATP-dependent phosphofructokinase / diphosphate-dependent phosphofructokinase